MGLYRVEVPATGHEDIWELGKLLAGSKSRISFLRKCLHMKGAGNPQLCTSFTFTSQNTADELQPLLQWNGPLIVENPFI